MKTYLIRSILTCAKTLLFSSALFAQAQVFSSNHLKFIPGKVGVTSLHTQAKNSASTAVQTNLVLVKK